jgi:hypothetical protein
VKVKKKKKISASFVALSWQDTVIVMLLPLLEITV